ncbi:MULTISPECIES: hypothetical protein [Aeromonas]|uniref:hypothetical protein n=1 Tax=Aeromonas TaxID=642 RepID=UPI002449E289|nr:hypothetical protein [Aeromonas dhakensis]MDH0346249.1 hypothetical protein [Aeromonas dhakensis]HDX8645046.1 hypothetical protein [Aeromonas dhakensis]HDZ8880274.1 hypothetical protein [Aeromonas dhakensis]
MDYKYSVNGSEGNVYTVILKEDDGVFNLSCDCAAGSYGKKCKHKSGIIESILNGHVDDISKSDFLGSELYSHYVSLKESEAELEQIKKDVKRKTARLERIMAG